MNLPALDLMTGVKRTGGNQGIHFIGLVQSPACQASPDILFVLGMDITGFMGIRQIDDHCHSGVLKIEGLCLSLPQFSPAISAARSGTGFFPITKLNPVKPKVWVLKGFSPSLYQGVLLLVVSNTFCTIGFALVPDRTAQGVGSQGMNHGVVNRGRGTSLDLSFLGVSSHALGLFRKFGYRLESVEGGPGLDPGTSPIRSD